jgi:hypothetical protein
MYELSRVIVTSLVMMTFGILGSYCRYIWNAEQSSAKWSDVVFPGVASAFVVPLFLSVGDSGIFKDVLAGQDFWSNVFLVAGFCTLAGVSSHSFVNALAQRALQTAQEARDKVEKVQNDVDAAVETLENDGEADASSNKLSENQKADIKNKPDVSSVEAKILDAFFQSVYTRRTLGGLVRDTRLERSEVRSGLMSLIKQGLVGENISQKTGNPLYFLVLSR